MDWVYISSFVTLVMLGCFNTILGIEIIKN